jgi:putative DNA primase/helicase
MLGRGMSARPRLVLDDAPPREWKDSDRFHCTPLTGAAPSTFVDLAMFNDIVVVVRNGTRKLAEQVRDAFQEAAPETVPVRLTLAKPETLDAEISDEDDFSLAAEFLTSHQHEIRYVLDVGRWITWSSVQWLGLYDPKSEVKPRAILQRMLAARGREQARAIIKTAKKLSEDGALHAKAVELARRVEQNYRSTRRLNAVWGSVEVMATDSASVTIQSSDLNRDPALLNCLSGLIDLRTGRLLPHDPAELCTAVCPYTYVEPERDPDGRPVLPPAPTFERFLAEAQPDPEVRAYLMRRAGLCAYGAQRTHVFPIDLGNDGRNGKGRLAEIISHVLGEYAITARAEILLVTRNERHLTQIASLVHRRFVWVDETRATRSLDGAQVKSLSGGAPQRCNFMRADEFSYVPAFTMLLTTNEMPKFAGQDRALGTRLQITPWEISFAGREDEDLLDKLKVEGEGVLARIVWGAVDYLSGSGLRPPEAVRETTSEERIEHDPQGKWLAEHLFAQPGQRVYTDWLYEQFTAMGWTEIGTRPFAMRLSTWLGEQGWAVEKVQLHADGKRWRGWEGIGYR